MSKVSKNNKYVTLENVRLSYDEVDNVIRLTAKDDDLPNGFALTLNRGTETEEKAYNLLVDKQVIRKREVPKYVRYEPKSTSYDNIYLGEDEKGSVFWNVQNSPHALIVGARNSGRTVVLQNIIAHCAQYATVGTPLNERWTVMVSDTKDSLLNIFADNQYVNLANTTEKMFSMIEWTLQELIARKNARQADYSPILVVVDDIFALRYSQDNSSDVTNSDRSRIKSFLDIITENGAEWGIHVVFSTTNFTRETLNQSTLDCVETRITVGALDDYVAENVLDEDVDTSEFTGGRSLISQNGETVGEFQPAYDKNGRWFTEFIRTH